MIATPYLRCLFEIIDIIGQRRKNEMIIKLLIGTDQDYIAYCASKGAVNMYTKQLACEWDKHGITVNAIAPTFTRTPINAFQLDDPVFYKNPRSRSNIWSSICPIRYFLK